MGGKTMFETILANYPKRTDLWSVYADQLTKTGDLDSARALFRRMATLNLQAKKMKFLFKKWLDFETGHGTEAGVSEVKQSAQKYLEGKKLRLSYDDWKRCSKLVECGLARDVMSAAQALLDAKGNTNLAAEMLLCSR